MTSWSSVDGLRQLLGPAWALLAAFGAFVGGLVPLLEPMLAVLAHSWDLCGRSWAALGACVGGLGRSRGLCWRSCAALGAYVGGLGPLLEPMLKVLGLLSSLSGQEGGLGRGAGRKVAMNAKPEREARGRNLEVDFRICPENVENVWMFADLFR